MDTRIIELAIEALEQQQKGIDAYIAELRSQLPHGRHAATEPVAVSTVVTKGGRRTRTAAERRAHSKRMKEIWAARKAKAGKPKAKAAKTMSAANKARSEKMKASWAARKAAKAKK